MTLYKGNTQIRDRGTFGVYSGSTPIKRIYKGSQLVYQFESYTPNQDVVNISNGQTATMNFKKGVYHIFAQGGAGGTASYTAIAGLTLSNIQTITGNTGASVVNANPGNAASVASTGTYGKGGSGGYSGPANDEENGWCYVHYTKEYTTIDTYKAFNV